MEEFIDDIVGSDEVAKTETEMATEIQEGKVAEETVDKVVADDKSKTGSEATPDESKDDAKVVDAADTGGESDAVKELATQLGWREDHTGNDSVDASTYILKSKDIQKSMGQHNKDLKDQLQTLGGSVDALQKHNENVYQSEVNRLTREVADLKKERRAAVELADVSKVDDLDEQIEQKQKDIDAPKPINSQVQKATDNPVYDEWIENNEWYLDNDDMARFADTVAQQYDGAPLERIYAIVRTKVQEIFPDRFEITKPIVNPSVDPVTPVGPKSPVESSSAKGNDASFTKADLTSGQMQIMNQFVKGGIMTEEQYVKDIAKLQ